MFGRSYSCRQIPISDPIREINVHAARGFFACLLIGGLALGIFAAASFGWYAWNYEAPQPCEVGKGGPPPIPTWAGFFARICWGLVFGAFIGGIGGVGVLIKRLVFPPIDND
jgi:hypothetical protein